MKKSYENHRKALKAAWTNLKAGRYATLSESLKSAWAWVKSNIRKGVSNFHIIRETEKAICVSADAVCEITHQFRKWNFWCPKSIVKNNEIPSWFIEKKEEEMQMDFSYSGTLRLKLN